MAYDIFTKETVFVNQNINSFCNKIFQNLIDSFTSPTINTSFCVTGTVAKIIQGDPLSDIVVIPFITNNTSIYDYCAKTLPKYLGVTAIKFKDRIQIKYNQVFFEIWYTDSIGTINTVSGLLVQDPADINPNIN